MEITPQRRKPKRVFNSVQKQSEAAKSPNAQHFNLDGTRNDYLPKDVVKADCQATPSGNRSVPKLPKPGLMQPATLGGQENGMRMI